MSPQKHSGEISLYQTPPYVTHLQTVWRLYGDGVETNRFSVPAEAGSGDVSPRMAVRACSAERGRGSEREHGMDLRRAQGQSPLLAVRDACVVAVGNSQHGDGQRPLACTPRWPQKAS